MANIVEFGLIMIVVISLTGIAVLEFKYRRSIARIKQNRLARLTQLEMEVDTDAWMKFSKRIK